MMTRSRFRLSTRTTMAVIAAIALVLGAVKMIERKKVRQAAIAYHRVHTRHALNLAINPGFRGGFCGTGYERVPQLASDPCRQLYYEKGVSPNRDDYLRDAAFHLAMQRHYESQWW
jgi:hypothetical protein